MFSTKLVLKKSGDLQSLPDGGVAVVLPTGIPNRYYDDRVDQSEVYPIPGQRPEARIRDFFFTVFIKLGL